MTSVPGLTPTAKYALCSAAVPLFIARAWRVPVSCANRCSNSAIGPSPLADVFTSRRAQARIRRTSASRIWRQRSRYARAARRAAAVDRPDSPRTSSADLLLRRVSPAVAPRLPRRGGRPS